MEKYYPEMIPNFSTAKSPQMMMGAMVKSYYAEQIGKKPDEIFHVSIMPCTSKKYEITRTDEHMYSSGQKDVDVVITTRELARMIKSAGIDFPTLGRRRGGSRPWVSTPGRERSSVSPVVSWKRRFAAPITLSPVRTCAN